MKTFSTILFAFAFCLFWLPDAGAQDWTIYNGDVLPNDESLDRPFVTSSGSYNAEENSIVDGNILQMDISESTGTTQTQFYWRMRFDTEPVIDLDELTVVFRAKGNPDRAMALDLDVHFKDLRSRVSIFNGTNLADIRNGTGDDVTLDVDVTEWNTYRFTMNATETRLYVNEETDPSLVFTPQAAVSGNSHFRFGDGDSGNDMGAQIDWVAWDVTGAYSPSDQSLPSELVVTPLGDWVIYNADELPEEADPAWIPSNGSGTTWAIEADTDWAGNNLLALDGADASGMYKTADFDSETSAITVVMRAKAKDLAAERLTDIDIHVNGFRDQLNIRSNGTLSLQRSGESVDLSGSLDVTEWNIYRMTIDASSGTEGVVNIYLNEDPTPVLTATTTQATGDRYFRFGDGNSSPTYSAYVDFVAWDLSGTFSPEQTRLPTALTNPPLGEWIVYEANELPEAADPAWIPSNGSGTTWAVEGDPDKADNNLLALDGADASGMYKTADFDVATSAITVVMKVKAKDLGADRLTDIDIHVNGFRDQLNIRSNGTLSLQRSGESVDLSGSLDVTEWNTYRMTIDASSGTEGIVNIYLNEDPTPVLTATTTQATGDNYFRFGDGNGGPTYSAYVDFITWDVSGAYSPEQTRLPDHLTGAIVDDVEPTISTSGTLAALIQDLGFSDDNTVESYTVSGSNLEGDITITPPVNFEVSLNETDWFANDSPLVLAHTDGTVEETTIFVRLNATEVGEFSAEISHISEGADEQLVAVSGTTVDLVPEISLTESLEEFVKNLSSPVSSQNYRVSGQNLKGSITVTAPDDFEISGDEENWGSEIVIDAEERIVTNRIVYVRLSATALGSYSGDISHTATDAEDVNLAVSGEVIPDPGITVTGELTAFSQGLGTPSEPQTYTIMGANLAGNIEISLPEGFEISFNGQVWLPSLSLAPIGGNVAEMTLYVRLNALAQGDSEGEIVHSSAGVDAVSLSVSGTTGPGLVTSLDEAAMRFNLWPNPSSDRIIFERGNASSRAQLTIHSLSGQIVSSNKFESGRSNLEIDINTLPQGVYLIEYVDDSRNQILKFIKE